MTEQSQDRRKVYRFPSVLYVRPDGERFESHASLFTDDEAQYEQLAVVEKLFKELGLELTAEDTGVGINVCIDDPTTGNFKFELWPNDEELTFKTRNLLLSFVERDFQDWRKATRQEQGLDPYEFKTPLYPNTDGAMVETTFKAHLSEGGITAIDVLVVDTGHSMNFRVPTQALVDFAINVLQMEEKR